MPQDPLPELQALREASRGLTYPSDSDVPFDVFCWEAQGAGSARQQVAAHGGMGRKIEQVPVETFFAQLDDSEDAARYRQLQQTLESQLSGLMVFRVGAGEVRVDVYLIGRTHGGNWAGLHTVSVET